MTAKKSLCGFVGIVGRPNVGKSTLLNRILGKKLSITSHKPQTTRHRILGLKTVGDVQTIYVDTPGFHTNPKQVLHRYMNKMVSYVISDVDIAIFVVDVKRWTEEDEAVLEKLKHVDFPVILAVNKVDEIKNKETLLPLIQELSEKMNFASVIPISAAKGTNIEKLESEVVERLPENSHFYGDDQFTDRSEKFLAAEFIREKLTRCLGAELPYALTVDIESFKEDERLIEIHALILVDKGSQKQIVIGTKGKVLKEVGTLARLDIEALLGKKVLLRLWVKVKKGWADSERDLKSLGFDYEG